MRRFSLFASVSAVAIIVSSAAFAANNTVNLWQSGTDQDASISETGVYGLVNLQQENGYGSGGNEAVVSQSGDTNWLGYYWNAKQSGSANYASVTQEGYHGDVELTQNGNNNGRNDAWWGRAGGVIWQDASAQWGTIVLTENSNNALFNLAQTGGVSNRMDVTQSGDASMAQVLQFGGSNDKVTLTQDSSGGAFPGYFVYAWLQQGGGDSNKINASQTGWLLGLDVYQYGNDNDFESNQTGYSNMAGLDAGVTTNVFISQVGDWNFVSNNQSNQFNTANGAQGGYNNKLYNFQTGKHANLQFNQANAVYTGNYIYNNQTGEYNSAILDQEGNGNSITSNQYGYSGIELLTATQLGIGNTLTSVQTDGVQTATVYQNGSGNNATGSQSGSANVATVSQVGNYNTANYTQTGTGGTATIVQN